MSMPSYWYDPIGGNAATGQPAMSADQINASMWGSYSPYQAQSTLNNTYGAGGFGGLTSYYSGLGAAYGRANGGGPNYQRRMSDMGTGGIGSDAARVPAAVPQNPFPTRSYDWNTTFNNMVNGDSSNPYVLGTPSWYPSQRTPYSGGGIGSDSWFGPGFGMGLPNSPDGVPRPIASPNPGG